MDPPAPSMSDARTPRLPVADESRRRSMRIGCGRAWLLNRSAPAYFPFTT
jgi:hypothetical protein